MDVGERSTYPAAFKVKWILEDFVSHFDPLSHPLEQDIPKDKSGLEECLDAIRSKLTEYHEELKRAKGELERKLVGHRITILIKLAKKVKWMLNSLQHPERVDDYEDRLAHAKGIRMSLLLPNPLKHDRTDCPFHTGGSKGSMHVLDGFVYCFHCQKGWDPIDFIMELHGCDFKSAIEYLQSF